MSPSESVETRKSCKGRFSNDDKHFLFIISCFDYLPISVINKLCTRKKKHDFCICYLDFILFTFYIEFHLPFKM